MRLPQFFRAKLAAYLKILSQSRTASRKVANVQYDVICRLQVLEGVAGSIPNSWTMKGIRGLKIAQETLSEESGIDPLWFSPKDTGMFLRMKDGLGRLLKSLRNTSSVKFDEGDVMDYIHTALLGLQKSSDNLSKPPLWVLGRNERDRVISGDLRPGPELANKSVSFIKLKVLNDIKGRKREQLDTDETSSFDRKDESAPDAGTVILQAFRDRSDPLGKALRAEVKGAIKPDTVAGKVMVLWVDHLESTGDFLSNKEMSEALDVVPAIVSKAWKIAWEQVFPTIWKNKRLISELEHRFLQEGVDYNLDKPKDFEAAWESKKTL